MPVCEFDEWKIFWHHFNTFCSVCIHLSIHMRTCVFTEQMDELSKAQLLSLLDRWLGFLGVCCFSCAAASQNEVKSKDTRAHNICDLLRFPNIRWISFTLWLIWWVSAVPACCHILYSCACAHILEHTQYMHTRVCARMCHLNYSLLQ